MNPESQPFFETSSPEALYQEALKLINSDEVKSPDLLLLLKSVPMFQNYPREIQESIVNNLERVNKNLEDIRSWVYPEASLLVSHLIALDSQEAKKEALDLIRGFLLNPDFLLEKVDCSEKEILTATSHLGLELAAHLFRRSSEEKEKATWCNYLLYFTTIHELLAGVRTNAFVFMTTPDECDLTILRKIMITVTTPDPQTLENLQLEFLLGGDIVSLIQKTSKGAFFTCKKG